MTADTAARRVAMVIVITFGSTIFMTNLNWCAGPAIKDGLSSEGLCFEFWMNRYQTLIGALIALTGVIVAYIAVERQIRASRSGEYRDALRELHEFKFDVLFTSYYLQDKIDFKELNEAVAHATTVGQLLDVGKKHAQIWERGRKQARSTASRSYRIVPSRELKRSIDILSRVALDIDNCASDFQKMMVKCRRSDDLDYQKGIIQNASKDSSFSRTTMNDKLVEIGDEVMSGVDREIEMFEAALLRAAPPPKSE